MPRKSKKSSGVNGSAPATQHDLSLWGGELTRRIDGLEHIPNEKCIFIANHQSYIDGPLILLMIAWYKNAKVYTFATNEKFLSLIWNCLFEHFGAIRVNGSMEKALAKIEQGNSLALWPEGGRSDTEEVQTVTHFGLGVIALKTHIPIVPIGLDTYHFWNKYQTLWSWRRCMVITIGKPIRFNGRYSKTASKKVVMTV
ncbi:MAG: lysophospholipid acyltransferase family protein, partial [Patescibacteria group bacterium]